MEALVLPIAGIGMFLLVIGIVFGLMRLGRFSGSSEDHGLVLTPLVEETQS